MSTSIPKEMATILTYTGKHYTPFKPSLEDICIEDIAHSLANQCRYIGHTTEFYSVAQHSMHVCGMVPAEYRLEALLHDAAEAYCHDIAAPLKAWLPDYQAMLRQNELAVRLKFGLPAEESQTVKFFDKLVGAYERSSALTLHEKTKRAALAEIERLSRMVHDFWKGAIPWGHNFPQLFPTADPRLAESVFIGSFRTITRLKKEAPCGQ